MWQTFLFGCLFEALSGALVAMAWLRMRKAEQAIAAKMQEIGELQGQLAAREAQTREIQAANDAIRQEQSAKSREHGVISERCAQVEKALLAKSQLEREHQLREESWNDRRSELEARLSSREQELKAQGAALTSLQRDVQSIEAQRATREQELQAREALIAGLQRDAQLLESQSASRGQELQAREALIADLQREAQELTAQLRTQSDRSLELESEIQRLVQSTQASMRQDWAQDQTHSLRIGELEGTLAGLEQELQERAATIDGLREEGCGVASRSRGLEQRCSELEILTQEARQGLQREQELQAARSARTAELELEVENRAQEVRQRDAMIEALQGESVAKETQLGAIVKRCMQLESELARVDQAGLDQQRVQQELQAEWKARVSDFERALENRTQELQQRDAAIQGLRTETAQRESQVDALSIRCGELEQEVRRTCEESLERLRFEQDVCEALSVRAGELEQQVASRDQDLRERSEMIERLQGEIGERRQQLEQLSLRCGELEQLLQQTEVEHQDRLRREHATAGALSARVVALEDQLAKQEALPRQGEAQIEQLQAEDAAKRLELEALERQLVELERELEAQRESAQDARRLDEQLQGALSARASDLENRVADSTEELQREMATVQSLKLRVEATAMQLEAVRLRNNDLESQARASAEQQADQEAASAAIAFVLEEQLAGCKQQILASRAECAQLAERSQALSDRLAQRARDVEDRDRLLAMTGASLEELGDAVQACHAQSEADAALIDELAHNRIAAIVERRKHQRSAALPRSYVEALAQGDLPLALQGLLGDSAPLSQAAVERLCERWRAARLASKQSPFRGEVAYLWAGGVHLEAGTELETVALLVVIAARVDGSRDVIAVERGARESKDAWLAILGELAERGMNTPRIVVGDGALGIWSALDELGWPSARQYCWSRKTAEVLVALPRERRAQATNMLQAIPEASSRTAAKHLRDRFVRRCGVRLDFAGKLVTTDWKPLTSFFAFPKEHWIALRTADAVEAPLAALRLRASKPKAAKHAPDAEAILWKLLCSAVETWPPLDALHLVPSLITSVRCADQVPSAEEQARAG